MKTDAPPSPVPPPRARVTAGALRSQETLALSAPTSRPVDDPTKNQQHGTPHVRDLFLETRGAAPLRAQHPSLLAGTAPWLRLCPSIPFFPFRRNLIEKIIAHHAIGLSSPYVKPGEAVCVRVDWTMANELTLVGINDMYTKIGRPGVANKERVVRIGGARKPRLRLSPRARFAAVPCRPAPAIAPPWPIAPQPPTSPSCPPPHLRPPPHTHTVACR